LLENFDEKTAALVLHCFFSFLFPFYGFLGAMLFIEKTRLYNELAVKTSGSTISYFDWNSDIPIVFLGVCHSSSGNFT
jgi:hypothetical protein